MGDSFKIFDGLDFDGLDDEYESNMVVMPKHIISLGLVSALNCKYVY